MNFINKKLLIILLAGMLAFGLAGCDLLSSTTVSTTADATTTMNLTTSATATTEVPTTTTGITTTTTVEPITTTTAVHNVALLLSGAWKTVYESGSSFDPTGLVVTLLRSDASETVITEYFVLGFNPSVPGLQTVRVRYGGVESSFTVYVKEPAVLADLALELTLPAKLVYQPGQSADWTGLVVQVVQSDGDKIELDPSSYVVSGFDSASSGLIMIIVTYDDLSASFPIYVADATSAGIALSVTGPTNTVYLEGDALNLAGLVVTLTAAGQTPITLTSGQYTVTSPNMGVAGNYDVAISALGLEAYFSITINPGEPTGLDLIPYFDDAEDLEGQALFLVLREIINVYTGISYGDVRYVLDETDADPNHAGYLIEWYTGQSRNATWDLGVTYNREHVWPQSLLGASADNAVINICSDVFNLTPADPSINSSRGNKWFSTVTNTYSYLPSRAAILGDIARILFYMAVMYPQLSLIELNATQDPAVYQMGDLSTLLAWHLADPVDAFERNRNNVIYSYQHNRNPFVDHPELVGLIWGNA